MKRNLLAATAVAAAFVASSVAARSLSPHQTSEIIRLAEADQSNMAAAADVWRFAEVGFP